MPGLLASQNEETLSDLVAYLFSLRNPDEKKPLPTNSASESREEKGAELFERLGCIACHTLAPTETHPEWNRHSLHFVKAKFQPGQLQQFLSTPHRHHASSLMPDFHLSEDESSLMAEFLEKQVQGTVVPFKTLSQGNVDRGMKRFVELRCDHCHQISSTSTLGEPDIRTKFAAASEQGCLRSQPSQSTSSSTAPVFAWTDDQRDSLNAYLGATSGGTVLPAGVTTQVERSLKSLRCLSCHTRDVTAAHWPEIIAEEGSGKLPDAVPQLTWVGEKLQGPWIEKLLKGEVKHKPRPG